MGGFGAIAGQFKSPRGIAAGSNGDVYVGDTDNNRVQEFDASGGFVREWGGFGSGEGQFHYAAGVAADPLGNVYVSESYPNDRIQVFGDPPPTVADLREAVEELGLPHGTANSLEAKLKSASGGGPAGSVAGRLSAFVAELKAQSGKHVPAASAEQLIAEAERAGGEPSCSGQ